jgi:hypothetical protein
MRICTCVLIVTVHASMTARFVIGQANRPASLDTAVARMGGLAALRSVATARVDLITEWQRTTLDGRMVPAVEGYEWSTELRSYSTPAWRNTRRFFSATGLTEIVDLVVDSVATLKQGGRWGPQSGAYVDERDEVFMFAPERLMVLAHDAADAHTLADTVIEATLYARVAATLGKVRPTLFFRRGDGLLALARFNAAQPRDMGLAGWGQMDVDIWYSRWRKIAAAGITLPSQLDVYRAGRLYKRMTAIAVAINPAIPPESLTVSDALRAVFLSDTARDQFIAFGRRPMFDLPLDSARITGESFALFNTNGAPAGAVKLGGAWVLFETGAAPLSTQRSLQFLRQRDAGAVLGGTLVTAPVPAGGTAWLVGQPPPLWVSAAASPYVEAVLRGWKQRSATVNQVVGGQWIHVAKDSLRLETIDLPDYPSTTVVYVPSLRWVYAWPSGLAQRDFVAAYVQSKAWSVDRLASGRAFYGSPLSPPRGTP